MENFNFGELTQINKTSVGLVPVIVQDVNTKEVLMLGFTDEQAFNQTKQTKQAHFWSRSRGEVWHKGATSGNLLDIIDIKVDCDNDALLYVVNPHGPACHRGTISCFD